MNDLFTKLDNLEKVPTDLLNKMNTTEDEIFSHTEDKIFDFKEPEIRQGYTPNAGGNDFLQQTPYNGQKLNVGSLFDSKIAVDLMDVIIPAILVVIVAKYTNQKILKSKFQLTASEKNTIQPVLQNYLNSINFSVDSPFNALILTVAVIYGSKTIEIIGVEIDKPKELKPTKDFIDLQNRTEQRIRPDNMQKSQVTGKAFTRKEGEKRGRKPKF